MQALRQCMGAMAASLVLVTPARGLTFEFDFTAGTPAQAQLAFQTAGNLWASVLSDPISIRLTVGTAVLGGSILAQAASSETALPYPDVRAALVADATSSSDALALSNLPATSFNLLINRTAQNGNSATPYLDNNGSLNNSFVAVTTANAAALGLPVSRDNLGNLCLSDCDGFIQFNSSFAFDFDRSNGITSGQFDFIGIAAHEIGHTLGFVSGVDTLDSSPGFAEDAYTVVTTLDLFRTSTASAALGAIDFTASNTAKVFSLTGAASGTLLFSNGISFGDGRQASHWKDGLGLGMMDPTASTGELLVIGANDRLALDAIGWNVSAVPEPGRPTLLALGLAVLCVAWRRRRGR